MRFVSAKDLLKEKESPSEELPVDENKPIRKKREKKPSSARSSALRLLSLGDHSSLGLREKLTQRGFSAEEISETIEYLKANRLLNDLRYGENLIFYLANRKYYGAYKIRMELPGALEEFDFPALAREFAEKSQNRGKSREQMIRLLKARGYAVKDIRFAVEGRE